MNLLTHIRHMCRIALGNVQIYILLLLQRCLATTTTAAHVRPGPSHPTVREITAVERSTFLPPALLSLIIPVM